VLRLSLKNTMDKEKRNEAIKMTIKLYPHKYGNELAMEIIDYLDRLESSEKDGNNYLKKLYSQSNY